MTMTPSSLKTKGVGFFGKSWYPENQTTIALAKFFPYVIAGSIGFVRLSVLAIGLVRQEVVNDPRFRIF